MSFIQSAPRLSNPWSSDRALRAAMRRLLPPDLYACHADDAEALGRLVAEDLYPRQLAERLIEPRHVPFDAWGERIDRIELTPLWREMPAITTRHGLVWHGYDAGKGEFARLYQFALVYLFTAASDFWSCPLAMSDGAARALLESGERELIERAVPRLTARDPAQLWTSGQWMTETTGGSDVSRTETRAVADGEGGWRLYGRKWFTSAATSEMALLLARPEGAGPGADALALFYIEPRDAEGRLQNIVIDRLKDKLGSRKLPTAELRLCGAPARLLGEARRGVRKIAPVLNQTRVWNALAALSYLRRGLQLWRDYAGRREVFGALLSTQPAFQQAFARVQAELEAGLQFALHVALWMGQAERGLLDESAASLLRLMIPLLKLSTARQAVAGISEIIEGFGGAGYIEDTGLPALLRDAQVFSIWEGTTDVLSLDAMKVLAQERIWMNARAWLQSECSAVEPSFEPLAAATMRAFAAAEACYQASEGARIAKARGIALTLSRCFAMALLLRQADWSLREEGDRRPLAAARCFFAQGLLRIDEASAEDAELLTNEGAIRP